MTIRLKATLGAVILSLPFVVKAAWYAHAAATLDEPGYWYSYGAVMIYALGSPLTLLHIVFTRYVRPLRYDDNWWAIPVMSSLFILQWVIWAQCIVWLVQRRREP
jgi:hypothetical protein